MTTPNTRTLGDGDEGVKHANPRYPKRPSLDLAQDDHDVLLGARYADRVLMADRIRALASQWRADRAPADAVSIQAQQLLPPALGFSPQRRPGQPSPSAQGASAS